MPRRWNRQIAEATSFGDENIDEEAHSPEKVLLLQEFRVPIVKVLL